MFQATNLASCDISRFKFKFSNPQYFYVGKFLIIELFTYIYLYILLSNSCFERDPYLPTSMYYIPSKFP